MISSSQAIRSLGSGPTGTPALPWPVAVVADTRRRHRLAGAATAAVVADVAPVFTVLLRRRRLAIARKYYVVVSSLGLGSAFSTM